MAMSGGAVPAGYTVVSELGVGRFGRAVLCQDAADRSIVVRISGISGDRAAALEAELRTVAAAASHPCAVAIPKVWTDPELGVCFEQAHCPGVAAGPVSAEVAAVGGVRLAAALAHAHRLGLLHGDLRPDDVMLDADGNWLLADGGVLDAIRRARPELAVERDSLFSPRELRGWEAPAESADVYSLGATLRALLGDTAVDAGMDSLLGRMVAPNPADRPSLVEVDEVLRAAVPASAQAGLPLRPGGPRPAPVPPRPAIRVAPVQSVVDVASNRRKTLVVAGAVGAVFLAAAGGVAAANSGSDHGGATAAAATATLAPSAAPTNGGAASGAAAGGSLHPIIVLLEPDDTYGIWRLRVQWKMPSMTPAVEGWRVDYLHPTDLKHAFYVGTQPSKGITGNFVGQWDFPTSVPLNSCAMIETVADGVRYQSLVKCPKAAQVSAAVAANAKIAKAAAAAKKAAAKKG
jgi:hypothetical protein